MLLLAQCLISYRVETKRAGRMGNDRGDILDMYPCSCARFSPSFSISALISAQMTLVSRSPLIFSAWSSIRNAMSPVPPATSRMLMGWPPGLRPGFKERTKWSFQRRWIPKDIASFITSYEEATEEKTSWTIDVNL